MTVSEMSSPKASRQTRPRWLDPKLFLGILLVLGSMAAGARIIAEADQTVEIWVAKEDIPENAIVTEDMLGVTRVRFASSADSDLYLSAASTLSNNIRAVRTIAKGEFVPAKALTDQADESLTDMAIPVESSSLTSGLNRGDKVDVWVVPDDDGATEPDPESTEPVEEPSAEMVLTNVTLMALPESGGLGASDGSAVTVRFAATPDLNLGVITYKVQTGQVSIAKHVAPKPVTSEN